MRPDAESMDFTRWPTLLEIEVPERGEAAVHLP